VTRRIHRLLLLAGLVVTALVGPAPAAAAHVAVDSASPNGDGTSTVTLVWDHGCTAGAATTGVTVSAGDGVEFTGAGTDLAGWSADVDPTTVTFGGPGIPTGQRSSVTVDARITAAPGAVVTFPSVQHCGQSQVAWTDPDPSAEHPAPTLIATAAVAAPVATSAQPDRGADLGQVLTGVLLLAAALATAGFLITRTAGR